MTYKKDFDKWNEKKKKIDGKDFKPPLFKEGEIWWVNIGENVGEEMSGKSEIFSRPVLIFKKLSQKMFLGIPLTTKEKDGSWFVSFLHKNKKQTAVLSQVKVISYKRMGSSMGQLDEKDFEKIKKAFKDLFY